MFKVPLGMINERSQTYIYRRNRQEFGRPVDRQHHSRLVSLSLDFLREQIGYRRHTEPIRKQSFDNLVFFKLRLTNSMIRYLPRRCPHLLRPVDHQVEWLPTNTSHLHSNRVKIRQDIRLQIVQQLVQP